MTVWVVYRSNGDGGYSKPLGVYTKKELADAFIKGSEAAYNSAYCLEMETNTIHLD